MLKAGWTYSILREHQYDISYKVNLFNFSFPGVLPNDDIISLLKIMSSKSPVNEIAAQIALDGGYNPCYKLYGNESFWNDHVGCEPGFVSDHAKEYCFKVLPDLENMSDGKSKCKDNSAAEMVLFDSNSQVLHLLDLTQKGKVIFS